MQLRYSKYLQSFLLTLLVATVLVWTGCDSADEEEDDESALFVGTWDAVSLTAAGVIDVLGDVELVATFQSNGTVRLIASDDSGELADLSGDYDVDSQAGRLTLSGDALDEDLDMGYDFVSNTELKLTLTGSDLQDLGIDLGEFGGIVGNLALTATLEKRA